MCNEDTWRVRTYTLNIEVSVAIRDDDVTDEQVEHDLERILDEARKSGVPWPFGVHSVLLNYRATFTYDPRLHKKE